ncbi:ABC transporter ATP-binding protein [Paenibacillus sp. J2TS4]|uniref:ABC transporter ATP-binding protein n=1 Tax=Paenibacillus sp. J2TS4 TaxID=2807194 RepID=UPI0020BE24B6|nr:ABC transporter ATP-binding protein [Paenibacillus sp. J2TS4]
MIFKDLSFAVPQGQKVLLLGPSGCGKSTLLQVLSGIIPDSIEVPLKYDSIQRPPHWGFVFQDPDTQFCMPYVDEELAFVLENLSVPRDQMERHMEQILATVGLSFDNLHTPIQTLSQGMKQRLALASVMLLQPDVLFLDEPSALLDPEGTEQIWAAVKEVSADTTLFIVEHKIEHVIDWVDRVVLFDGNGAILADGEPDEIFRSHKEELVQYGIWYPDVWKDYIRTEAYQALQEVRQKERQAASGTAAPVLVLRDFAGFRGEEAKIEVPQAEVLPGEWISVVGANGAGKSTLLQSIMQLLPTSGTYWLCGKPVRQTVKGRGKKSVKSPPPPELAFVFQNPEMQFITNSLYDELAYSLRPEKLPEEEAGKKVRQTLEAFGLYMSERRHPYQLSIGQKRRLSVASAVIGEKPVLLLDEPTFGQDARNTFAILEKLEELRVKGTAIIMVTHDPNIAGYFSDQIWRIEQGRLAVVESPEPWRCDKHEFVYAP